MPFSEDCVWIEQPNVSMPTIHTRPGIRIRDDVENILEKDNIELIIARDPTLEEAHLSIFEKSVIVDSFSHRFTLLPKSTAARSECASPA